MISTASAALKACPAGAPASSQPASVSAAAASTSGTKTPQTRSASRWMAALSACARPTSAISWGGGRDHGGRVPRVLDRRDHRLHRDG